MEMLLMIEVKKPTLLIFGDMQSISCIKRTRMLHEKKEI